MIVTKDIRDFRQLTQILHFKSATLAFQQKVTFVKMSR